MNRKNLLIAVLGIVLCMGVSGSLWAQQGSCAAPAASCSTSSNVTTSQIQIGGPGSVSSNNTTPATCDGGTPGNLISARLNFSFDRAAHTLTVVATNTTQAPNQGTLTGFGFNIATTDITLITLSSTIGATLTWSGAFDRIRTDNMIEVPSGTNIKDIKCDGFGRVNVFSGNKGVDTGPGGGDTSEILPGNSVTYVFDVTGDLTNVTACTFTSAATLIPPGDKTVLAVGRFQACNGGGSAWAGPCSPQDLLVSLVSDLEAVSVGDGLVRLRWETGAELDNAGFAILEQGSRNGQYRRLNETLIPAQGTPTSGAVYTYDHATALNGKRIKLRLEDWDTNGYNTIHRPIEVVPNPSNPPIKTVTPYEASFSRRGTIKLDWNSVAATSRRTLEISGDPTFPVGGTLEIKVGSTSSRSLSKREKLVVDDLSAFGDGGVYWRVKGQGPTGQQVVSDVSFFSLTD